MNEQSRLKKVTKSELHAVLNSSPSCLSLSRLESDYHKFNGHPIPYREMGYNTLADFVADIPDVVRCWMSYGQMMTEAVPNSKTERVRSLVQRNKGKRSDGALPDRKPREMCSPPKLVPQTSLPEYHILRGRIQQLFCAYWSGIPLSKFPETFAMRYGHYISPLTFGFASVQSLLESMNDIVVMQPLELSDDFIVQSRLNNSAASFKGFCIITIII